MSQTPKSHSTSADRRGLEVSAVTAKRCHVSSQNKLRQSIRLLTKMLEVRILPGEPTPLLFNELRTCSGNSATRRCDVERAKHDQSRSIKTNKNQLRQVSLRFVRSIAANRDQTKSGCTRPEQGPGIAFAPNENHQRTIISPKPTRTHGATIPPRRRICIPSV